VDAEELAATLLQVVDHHAAKLVIRIDHLVIDIDHVALGAEKVGCPSENLARVLSPHVDEQALSDDERWQGWFDAHLAQFIRDNGAIAHVCLQKFVAI